MSNHVKMYGRIMISPEFQAPGSIPQFTTVRFTYTKDRTAFAPYLIHGIEATGAEWSYPETLTDDLDAIIGMLPHDTLYIGHFECTDEYNDMWRVYIVNGKVLTVHPTIVWPEVPGAAAI